MGLTYLQHKVLNKNLPVGQRMISLCRLFEHAIIWGPVSFTEIVDYYIGKKWIFPVTDPAVFEIITEEMVEIRNQSLEIQKQYWHFRKQRKIAGYNKQGKADRKYKAELDMQVAVLWEKFKSE